MIFGHFEQAQLHEYMCYEVMTERVFRGP